MSSNEAKQIVQNGLERRKAERDAAAEEARLDIYEQEQIRFCNANYADAKMKRDAEQKAQKSFQERAARREAMAKAQAQEAAREDAATAAVQYYGVGCLVILLVAAVTKLPFWAAIALIAGLAVFPIAYIFRLYNPIGR